MTVFADINTIADFDSTVGAVADQAFGGYERGACIHSLGDTASPSYGRKSLGAERSVLYARGRLSIPLDQVMTVLRGRDQADANDCWKLDTLWSGRDMTLTLKVYHNSGSETFTLTPPVDCIGVCYPEVRIETGSGNGLVQAWMGEEEVLAETRIPPNDNRTSYYIDVGVIATVVGTKWQSDLDMIKAADEYIGLPEFSPTLERGPLVEGNWTKAVYKVEAWPVGGWQELLPNLSGTSYIVEVLQLIPGGTGAVQIANENNSILWQSPELWKRQRGAATVWRGLDHGLESARKIRITNLVQKCIIRLGVKYAT